MNPDDKPPPYSPRETPEGTSDEAGIPILKQNYQPHPSQHMAGAPPPPPMYHQHPNGPYMPPNYGSVIIQQQPAQEIIIVGGCPVCKVGILETDFSCLGICCAIVFFPLGILCCLLLRQRRCANCGASFG